MESKIERIKNDWYGRLEDLVEEIEEAGMEVEDANSEYITAAYEDDGEDVEIEFMLGGTERTITVESVREIYRG